MLLNSSDKFKDDGNDYAVLNDHGSDGFCVYSQHKTLKEAVVSMTNCMYGCPMSIVKLCRVALKEIK
jgi:hypothetical protein